MLADARQLVRAVEAGETDRLDTVAVAARAARRAIERPGAGSDAAESS